MNQNDLSIALFERIGELSAEGYLVYDVRQDAVRYANKAFAAMAGITAPAGHTLKDLRRAIQEEDSFVTACIHRLQQHGQLEDVEFRTTRGHMLSAQAYWLQEPAWVVAILKDVTNAKQFLDYISEFGARKDALLDMIAHNLSGPLNLTNNLLNLVDQVNQTAQYKIIDNHTRLIRENTQHCIEIINSFLREEHLASPGVYVESKRFDVVEKVNVVIERMKPFNEDKTILVHTDVAPLYISSDDVKFFQVVHNLVSNAVKFTPAEGTVAVDIRDAESTVTVTVADNGVGIPEHLQRYIFERNTPAGRPGLKGEKSIGMGLYIVRKLTELMHGEVTFTSREHAGATFRVTLPKLKPDNA